MVKRKYCGVQCVNGNWVLMLEVVAEHSSVQSWKYFV